MKTVKITALAIVFSAVSLFGANYTNMGTDELLQLRGVPKTQEERTALHSELMKRYEHMTQEQKQAFDNRPGRGMKGQGQGMRQGMGKNR